jgi:hypothetical protein
LGDDRKGNNVTYKSKNRQLEKNLNLLNDFEMLSHEIDEAIVRADFVVVEVLDQSRRNLLSKMELPKNATADEQWFNIAKRCVQQNDAAKEKVLGLMAELRQNTGSKLRQLSGYRPN